MNPNDIGVQKEDLGPILSHAPNSESNDFKSTLKNQALFCLKQCVKLFSSIASFPCLYAILIEGTIRAVFLY